MKCLVSLYLSYYFCVLGSSNVTSDIILLQFFLLHVGVREVSQYKTNLIMLRSSKNSGGVISREDSFGYLFCI